MNTIEIELRYEVLNQAQLASFIAPFQKIKATHDIDIYFDTDEGVLYQKGIFIRTRNNQKLDFKFNRACLENADLAIQDYCEEHTFSLPLQESDVPKINELLISLSLHPVQEASLEALKAVNNFIDYYTVDKQRASFKYKDFTIAIDTVANLGTFLEIEYMAKNTEQLEEIKQEMQLLLVGLDIKPLRTGYGTLLLRKQNFMQYLQGRFILEEDKAHRV